MSWRTGLAAIGLLAAAAPGVAAPAADPMASATTTEAIFGPRRHDPYAIALRAYVWGFPLVEAARIRAGRIASGVPLNRLGHERKRADPSRRIGVGPNNDTIYSNGWLDLASGPVLLRTPDFGDRYYSVQLAAADSSSEIAVGRRTHGGQLPPLFIVGPGDTTPAPEGALVLRSPTRYAMLANRILVADEADAAVVHGLQDQLRLTRPDGSPLPSPTPAAAPAPTGELAFLTALGHVLRDYGPLRPADTAMLASFAPIGLDASGFDAGRLTPAARAAVVRGLAEGKRLVEWKSRHLGRQVAGWTINVRGRASATTIYCAPVLPRTRSTSRCRRRRSIRSPASMPTAARSMAVAAIGCGCAATPPPVKAFWSITLYGDDGFMVDNPIRRYSIGDRTPGLAKSADGSIDILIGHAPAAEAEGNWLPAPPAPST